MEKYFELLGLARESIASLLENKEPQVSKAIKKKYSKKQACFVTLTLAGELRGCIGSLEPRQELWKDVLSNAQNAAFSDPRFEPLSEKEFGKIKIEVSVLSIPKKIEYASEEELKKKIKGKGVIIQKGFCSATYLPQVWLDIENSEDFISSLCQKAGLSRHAWKNLDLKVLVYDVEKVKE